MPAAPVKFAYWVPNVSGGLVTSKIEQRTDWGYDYNRELAVLAENNGFDYALSQVRYMASYGAEYQHESTSFSLALLLATQRLKVIAAVHPGLWHPGVLAKLGATADHLSERPLRRERRQRLVQGRVHRARRALAGARRALPPLRGVHPRAARRSGPRTTPNSAATSTGSATSPSSPSRSTPRPAAPGDLPGRQLHAPPAPWPAGSPTGTSPTARTSTESSSRSPTSARRPPKSGRTAPKFGLNGFLIARDTEAEARETLREIVAKADTEAVTASARPSSRPDSPPADGKGMWQDSTLRGPRPVQRRLPHRPHRHAGADRRADRRLQEARRGPPPARLPALPGGGRVLRQAGAAAGARAGGPAPGRPTARLIPPPPRKRSPA